jgi:hypothetical protein
VLFQGFADGRRLPSPADGLGETLWRRARSLSDRFSAEGYRSLERVEAGWSGDWWAPLLEGAGLRILQRPGSGRFVIRDAATGRRLHSGRLPSMPSFCGMSDEAPSDVPPSIVSGFRDRASGLLLLAYGHAYASCMCENDLAYTAVHLAP